MEACVEAFEFRIASLGEYLIQAFAVEPGLFGPLCHPALSFGHIPSRQQEQFEIALLQRRVQIFFGLTCITQPFNQVWLIEFGFVHGLLCSDACRLAQGRDALLSVRALCEPCELVRPLMTGRPFALLRPDGASMVLPTFAKTKVGRLPGRNPAIQNITMTRKLGTQIPCVHLPTPFYLHPPRGILDDFKGRCEFGWAQIFRFTQDDNSIGLTQPQRITGSSMWDGRSGVCQTSHVGSGPSRFWK